MQFYLIFPLLSFLLVSIGSFLVSAVVLCVAVVLCSFWLPHFPEPSLLLFKLPNFLCGTLLFKAAVAKERLGRAWLWVLATVLASAQFQMYGRYAVWVLVFVGVIATLSRAAEGQSIFITQIVGILNALLDNRLMGWASNLSYSVYLFHGFFIGIVGGYLFSSDEFMSLEGHIRTLVFTSIVLAGVLPTAVVVHKYIELPGIRAGHWAISVLRRRGSSGFVRRAAS